MKALTVKKLIELLKNVNPNAMVYLEGCDCCNRCVGYSKGDGAYKDQIILRTSDGVFYSDYLPPITKVK
jgi:hypothetical protein